MEDQKYYQVFTNKDITNHVFNSSYNSQEEAEKFTDGFDEWEIAIVKVVKIIKRKMPVYEENENVDSR